MSESPGYLDTHQDVIGARIGAFLIDWIISFVVAVAVGFAFAALIAPHRAMIFVGVIVGYIGYFTVLEGWTGQTVGKKLLGVIVIHREGRAITFGQALTRNLLRFIDGIGNYVVGLVCMLLTSERQRCGDILANTVVVRKK